MLDVGSRASLGQPVHELIAAHAAPRAALRSIPRSATSVALTHSAPAIPSASLRTNLSWTLVGNIVYAACQWGVVAALARLGAPAMVGQYALGLALTAPILLLTNLALRTVQATDAHGEYTFGHYLSLRVMTTLGALIAIVLAPLVVGAALETTLVIWCIGLAKAFDALGDVYHGLFQRHEQLHAMAKSMMLNGMLTLVALIVAVAATGELLAGVAASALVSAAVVIGYNLPAARRIVPAELRRPRWDARRLRRLAGTALPLGVAAALVSLNVNIPRYVIEHELDSYQLGIFAALAYLLYAGNTLVSALAQAALPRLALLHAGRDGRGFRRLLLRLVVCAAGLGAAAVGVAGVFGEPLLGLVYERTYAAEADVFVWLSIATALGFVAWFLDYGISAARQFRAQLLISSVVTGVLLAASLLLIPSHGLIGAAWASCLGAAALVAMKGCALLPLLRLSGLPSRGDHGADLMSDPATLSHRLDQRER